MSLKVHVLKRQLAAAIAASIANKGQSQRTVAAFCGITQSRVSNVVCGQLENFSLDSLVEIGDRLGCHVSLHIIPVEKPVSMAQALRIPTDFKIDASGFRDGCEDEFRFY